MEYGLADHKDGPISCMTVDGSYIEDDEAMYEVCWDIENNRVGIAHPYVGLTTWQPDYVPDMVTAEAVLDRVGLTNFIWAEVH